MESGGLWHYSNGDCGLIPAPHRRVLTLAQQDTGKLIIRENSVTHQIPMLPLLAKNRPRSGLLRCLCPEHKLERLHAYIVCRRLLHLSNTTRMPWHHFAPHPNHSRTYSPDCRFPGGFPILQASGSARKPDHTGPSYKQHRPQALEPSREPRPFAVPIRLHTGQTKATAKNSRP